MDLTLPCISRTDLRSQAAFAVAWEPISFIGILWSNYKLNTEADSTADDVVHGLVYEHTKCVSSKVPEANYCYSPPAIEYLSSLPVFYIIIIPQTANWLYKCKVIAAITYRGIEELLQLVVQPHLDGQPLPDQGHLMRSVFGSEELLPPLLHLPLVAEVDPQPCPVRWPLVQCFHAAMHL